MLYMLLCVIYYLCPTYTCLSTSNKTDIHIQSKSAIYHLYPSCPAFDLYEPYSNDRIIE